MSLDALDASTPAGSKELIAQLREAVPQVKDAEEWDDVELHRFLVARRKHVDKAAKMLRDTLEWRKKNKVDDIRSRIYPSPGAPLMANLRRFPFIGDNDVDLENGVVAPYAECYKNMGGFVWHDTDKEGHPIYIERTGLHDAVGFPKNVPMAVAIEWHVTLSEFSFGRFLELISKNTGNRITKVTAIMDLRGLGWHQFRLDALKYLQNFGKIDQDNYPERLHKVFVINAPPIFTKFWAFLKVGLDKRVLEKIHILGKDYQETLLKHIDAEKLPKYLGGKCTCSHMPTGCVPCYQMDRLSDLDSFQQYVGARDSYSEELPIDQAGSTINYRFSTKDYNISFGISYKQNDESTSTETILPINSYDSHTKTISDTIKAEKAGVYLLTWDNSSSLLRGKNITYSVSVDPPPGTTVEDAAAVLAEDIKEAEAREAMEEQSLTN